MKTFKRGGVHPPEHKELAEHKAIETLAVPGLLYVPVSQHIGAPASLRVAAGDELLKGQVVAEASGYVSTNIHSPVSGKVKSIEKIQDLLGKKVDHVVIENDHAERWVGGLNIKRDWQSFSVEELLNIVVASGIVGMGGATFPTHVKLKPPVDKKIDTLVINGVECEPYLTCDYRLMLERVEGLKEGVKIVQKILGVKRVIFGIESNKQDAFERVDSAFRDDPEVEVVVLRVKYPQGAEKQLIDSVLGREVPPGKLPLDVGVVVQNVATCFAVYEAVALNKPLIERIVTVTGDGVQKPANYLVRIGTPVSFLLEASGVNKKVSKLVSGGPMMGIAFFNADLPVLKGTSGVLAFTKVPNFMPGPCIRCGRCVEVCPLGGVASEIARAVEAGSQGEYEHLHVLDCMECGSCTFVCPARRPLVQYVKQAKQEMALKKKNSK